MNDAAADYEWHVAGAADLEAIRVEVSARSAEGWGAAHLALRGRIY